MRNALAFKKRYALLVILLAAVLFGVYQTAHFSPVGQRIIKKLPINKLINLYITEVNAGATTSFSYRFYLYDAKKDDSDFMKNLDDSHPFLITSDGNAFRKIENNAVHLSVKGDIFSFNNTPVIRLNEIIYSVPVYLTSSPWR